VVWWLYGISPVHLSQEYLMTFDTYAQPRPIMVLVSTAENNVPVIAEKPTDEEMATPEWREATEAEYARYLAYWDAHYDAEEAGLPLPDANTFGVAGE
jgi:hypothetical protein